MIDRSVRARALWAEAEVLGLTIDDLVAVATVHEPVSGPTVAEYLDLIEPSFTDGTRATYRSYWKIARDRIGARPIASVGVDDCEAIVIAAVERAKRRRPTSDGRSTRESAITALRALFGRATRAGVIQSNPAANLDKPRRLPNRRRALDDRELQDVLEAIRTTSNDPALDLLLVRFHLESGARREGALNLRLGDIDDRRSTVWLHEKFDQEREQPTSPSLGEDIACHAQERGGHSAGDAVFRTVRGNGITRRRYNTIFDRAKPSIPWATRTPVSAHVLRHTAITAVERVAGYSVAQAFAGHRSGTVTGTYTRARIDEVAAAVARLTGEDHPLARSEEE